MLTWPGGGGQAPAAASKDGFLFLLTHLRLLWTLSGWRSRLLSAVDGQPPGFLTRGGGFGFQRCHAPWQGFETSCPTRRRLPVAVAAAGEQRLRPPPASLFLLEAAWPGPGSMHTTYAGRPAKKRKETATVLQLAGALHLHLLPVWLPPPRMPRAAATHPAPAAGQLATWRTSGNQRC